MKPETESALVAIPVAENDDSYPFLQSLLSATKEVYADRTRTFSQLDQKAQTTAAMASVFLAALFAFLRKENVEFVADTLGHYGLAVLLGLSSGFLVTVLICLAGLRVRNAVGQEQNSTLLLLLRDMHSLEPQEQKGPKLKANFCRDLTGNLLMTVAELGNVNSRKARLILTAQCTLAVSIVSIAITLGVAVVRSRP